MRCALVAILLAGAILSLAGVQAQSAALEYRGDPNGELVAFVVRRAHHELQCTGMPDV